MGNKVPQPAGAPTKLEAPITQKHSRTYYLKVVSACPHLTDEMKRDMNLTLNDVENKDLLWDFMLEYDQQSTHEFVREFYNLRVESRAKRMLHSPTLTRHPITFQ
jgi:hypothetical protein